MESNNTIRINTCERAHVVQTHKYMDTVGQRESIVPQRWHAVTGGLCVAAAQRGPAGPCMQLCGRNAPTLALAGFWTSSTCGQLDGSALASLYQQIQRTPAERGCVEILDTVFFSSFLVQTESEPFSFSPWSLVYVKNIRSKWFDFKRRLLMICEMTFFFCIQIYWCGKTIVSLLWFDMVNVTVSDKMSCLDWVTWCR